MRLAKCLMMGLMVLSLLGCGSDDEEPSGEGQSLSSLQISPGEARVPVGFEQQFQVMAIWDDGLVQDVTAHPNIVWSSGDDTVLIVDDAGLARGIGPGTTLITATGTANGEPYSASATVEVLDVQVMELQITPVEATVPVGIEQGFVATAIFSDGVSREVTNASALGWRSQDEGIATVGNDAGRKGIATGVAIGSTIIEAVGSANGVSFEGAAQLAVTDALIGGLEIQAPAGPLPVGLTAQLHAFASLSDGSEPVEVTTHPDLRWSSEDPGVASVSAAGQVTGLAQGSATIALNGVLNGTPVTASEQISVSPAVVTRLEVRSAADSIPAGLQTQFSAIAHLSDGTYLDVTQSDSFGWYSDHPETATVSNLAGSQGLVTGLAAGSALITASGMAGGVPFEASARLEVSPAVVADLAITPVSASVPVDGKVQFHAMATLSDGGTLDVTGDAAISWISDTPGVAAISNAADSKGEATGLAEGGAQITATMGGITSPAAALAVVPAAPVAPILIEPRHNQIASLQLSPEEFAFWNSTSINSTEGQAALRELSALVYSQFRDEFDFITVVMNNEEVPSGMPTGEYAHVRNDVAGIGLGMFDSSAEFHSDGKLQGIWFLYAKRYLSTSTYGPILHEMAHRWANWVVPPASGHWAPWLGIVGQLNNVAANYADIELYLMGLMDPSEMTDPASLDAYALIPADQKPRVPSAANSQKEFRTLLLILSDRALNATEIQEYNEGATLLARTDNPTQQGTNFHKMTRGRGTLVVEGLDTLLKP